MIGGILAMADQAGERIPALRKRQTLHCRRQVQTDHRRGVGARKLGILRQDRCIREAPAPSPAESSRRGWWRLDPRAIVRSCCGRCRPPTACCASRMRSWTAGSSAGLASAARSSSRLTSGLGPRSCRMRRACRACHSLGERCRCDQRLAVRLGEIHEFRALSGHS